MNGEFIVTEWTFVGLSAKFESSLAQIDPGPRYIIDHFFNEIYLILNYLNDIYFLFFKISILLCVG